MSPIKPEQLKQKSQTPISQAEKIQMNTKVKNERPGSAFKMLSTKFHTTTPTSTTKSPIRNNKQCNAQGSTKPLQRTYCRASMDSDSDRVVASLNLEEIVNNYNTCNHLTVGKLISSLSFLNVNLLHIIHIYLNVGKQMTDVKLLLLHSNSHNHLTVDKQTRKSK